MTRTIKASEIKPGMEVEFTLTRKMMIHKVITWGDSHRELRDDTGHVARVDADAPVTVLAEPTPPQPEEPTAFGACVETPHWTDEHGCNRFVWDDLWWRCGRGGGYMWEAITEGGAVKVINPDPFARAEEVPEDTPKTPTVPERIEEWDTWGDVPEGVVVANPEMHHQYRKACGKIEVMSPIGSGVWCETSLPLWDFPGTWTHVTDA